MDWTAIALSAKLALVTLIILIPLAILLGRWLAVTRVSAKPWIEGCLHCRWYCRPPWSAITCCWPWATRRHSAACWNP
jgi:ABC-type molybdate transport system permease subunit